MIIGLFTDTYYPYINGVAASVETLKDELEKNGHTVYVITTNDSFSKVEMNQRILRIGGVELKKVYGNRMTGFYSFKAMKFIKQMNLDLIHVHTEFGIGIFARIVADSLRVPLVYTYHTMYEDYTHYISQNIGPIDRVMKRAARYLSSVYGNHCTELIAPSSKTKEALEAYHVNKKIHVIPTGIDLDAYQDASIDQSKVNELIEKYHLKGHQVVLSIGRIGSEKSLDLVIDGFNKAYQKNDNLRLVIVGDGPALDGLKKQVEDIKLQDVVVFTGAVEHKEVPTYYRLGDVFVSASITETQGLTFIEAQAGGLPVLCRFDENLQDIIDVGKNGYFFDGLDDFVEKLNLILNGDKKAFKTAALACANNFSSEVFYERVIEVYKEAINDYKVEYRVSSIQMNDQMHFNTANVTFKSGSKEVNLRLPVEVINDYGIKNGKEFDQHQLGCIKEYEQIIPVYQKASQWLSKRSYTEYEMNERLNHIEGIIPLVVDKVMLRLKNAHLIDDDMYAKNYLKEAAFYQTGIEKACKSLIKRGIDESIVERYRFIYEDEIQLEKVMNIISKAVEKNKTKSRNKMIASLEEKLIKDGYSDKIIEQAFASYDFYEDDFKENVMLLQAFMKIYDKYKMKLSGEVLEQKLYETLILEGFEEESVHQLIAQMDERGIEINETKL